jgi:prepilin-type N-terminal cleavage/methylation domain-containing protein
MPTKPTMNGTEPTQETHGTRPCGEHAGRPSRGFTLFEMSIVLVLLTTVIVFGLQYYRKQALIDQAHILAQQYKKLNAAIGTYMTVYYHELRDLPASCSNLAMREGAAPAVPAPDPACSLTLPQLDDQLAQIPNATGFTLANAMQPTMAELVGLGFLSRETSDIPAFAHHNTVYNANGVFERFRFAFLIDHACVGPPRTPLPDNTPPCAATNQDLRSLVFNTQPYFGPNAGDAARQAHLLGEVMVKAGADAAMTTRITPLPGELYGHRASWQLRNPIRTRTDQGMVNMVAMMNGFGASGFLQFTRRDGSLWPTDHWNFNQKNLHHVARLESKEGSFNDKLHIPYKVLGTPCNTARKPEDIQVLEGVNDKQDGIAFDRDARALLICDKGTWLHSRGKGAANWNDYIDVKISAEQAGAGMNLQWRLESPPGATLPTQNAVDITSTFPAQWPTTTGLHLNLGLDANQWGMPLVLESHSRGYRKMLEDSWCNFSVGLVETVVTGVAVVGVGVGVTTIGGIIGEFIVVSAGGGGGGGGGPVAGIGLGSAQNWCVEKKSNWTPIAQKPEHQMSIDPNSGQWILRTDMHNGGDLTVRFHKLHQ